MSSAAEVATTSAAPTMVSQADVDVFARHVLVASLAGLLASLGSMALLPGWVGATVAVGQGALVCLRMLHKRRSRWLANLVVAGLTAGVVELVADHWLVHGTRTLLYPEGPSVAASPIYMPFAWLGMLCAGLALGLVLRRRGASFASATGCVVLMLGGYIPLFEAIADRAGWWVYRDCPRLLDTVPHYIVLGEILLAAPLVWLGERLRTAGALGAVSLGFAQGAWIFASYALAHALVGGSG